jgi:hypothetical protein
VRTLWPRVRSPLRGKQNPLPTPPRPGARTTLTLRFPPPPPRKGSLRRQITFFASATPGRLPPWTGKRRTKSGYPLPVSSVRSSITSGKGGTVRAACTPLKSPSAGMVAVTKRVVSVATSTHTVRPGGIDSRWDEGVHPVSRRIQKRGHHLHQKTRAIRNFDFDALPALPVFQPSSSVTPAVHGRPRYRTREASPPPLDEETSLAEADRRGGTLMVEVPKAFIRRTQGRCGAAKEAMNDVLRSARSNSIAISSAPLQPPQAHHATSKAKEKERLDVKREQKGWRTRWNRVLSVPAFRSPLVRILSPVVTRAQWKIVVRSGILAFLISCRRGHPRCRSVP